MDKANRAFENTSFDIFTSKGVADLKNWQLPEIIVLQLSVDTRGNPAALFEDSAGIASS